MVGLQNPEAFDPNGKHARSKPNRQSEQRRDGTGLRKCQLIGRYDLVDQRFLFPRSKLLISMECMIEVEANSSEE